MVARPKVHSIAIELTAHCNQKCTYCYNPWREDNGASVDNDGGDQLLSRCDKLIDALEIDHVTLTGGEPFSRSEIWPLLDRLRDAEIGVQIISNGGLLTDRIAERLAPYRLRFIQITLNGPDAALHERHVGEGHYDKTIRGIEALTRHGVPVVGCVVVTRLNAAVLGEILALFDGLGVKQIALSRFSPAGYAVEHAAELLPSRADLMEAFGQAQPWARDRGMNISCTMPVPPCMFELDDYAPIQFGYCPIGTEMQELALGPDGRLKNCTLHDTAIGGVADILAEEVDLPTLLKAPEITEYRARLPEFCEGCLHANSCGGGCGAAARWMMGLRDDDKRLPDPVLWQHVDDEFEARIERERDGRRRLEVVS